MQLIIMEDCKVTVEPVFPKLPVIPSTIYCGPSDRDDDHSFCAITKSAELVTGKIKLSYTTTRASLSSYDKSQSSDEG